MSSQPSRRGTPRASTLALAVAVLVAAGCTTAGPAPGSPSPAGSPAAVDSARPPAPPTAADPSAGASRDPAASAIATTGSPPDPTAVGSAPAASVGAATGALPPPVALAMPTGGTVQGALGGYSWRGNGSDAPWVVPSRPHTVRSGGPYTATLDPAIGITRWVARWAPVDGEAVGDVAGFAEGTGRPITFTGPATPGAFGLSIEVTFAEGGHAAWYWRLEPPV